MLLHPGPEQAAVADPEQEEGEDAAALSTLPALPVLLVALGSAGGSAQQLCAGLPSQVPSRDSSQACVSTRTCLPVSPAGIALQASWAAHLSVAGAAPRCGHPSSSPPAMGQSCAGFCLTLLTIPPVCNRWLPLVRCCTSRLNAGRRAGGVVRAGLLPHRLRKSRELMAALTAGSSGA